MQNVENLLSIQVEATLEWPAAPPRYFFSERRTITIIFNCISTEGVVSL